MTYPQVNFISSATLDICENFPHTEAMADIMIRNIPAGLYSDLINYAKKSGLTLQQVVIKALENYVEKTKIESWTEARLKRAALPKIKANTIVDAIDSERKRKR